MGVTSQQLGSSKENREITGIWPHISSEANRAKPWPARNAVCERQKMYHFGGGWSKKKLSPKPVFICVWVCDGEPQMHEYFPPVKKIGRKRETSIKKKRKRNKRSLHNSLQMTPLLPLIFPPSLMSGGSIFCCEQPCEGDEEPERFMRARYLSWALNAPHKVHSAQVQPQTHDRVIWFWAVAIHTHTQKKSEIK